jgi:uncharacterized RDD family membrane protein YckC
MFCVRCGAAVPESAAFCSSCGNPVTTGVASPLAAALPGAALAAPAAPGSVAAPEPPRYSGFWRRFWSYLLDRLLLGIVFTPFVLLVMMPVMAASSMDWSDSDLPEEALGALLGATFVVAFFAVIASWLYYALMQSSSKQATLGQMALGIRVTDLQGRRISFGRATGRHFATILTGLTLGIGYLIMLLTEKKQTLHDLIASTLVVR